MPEPRPPAKAAASPARLAAFHILGRVDETDAHSDDLLHAPQVSALSPVDRNLATALVMGTLRWQIALDAQLRPLLAKPDVRLATAVKTALRLGAFQLLHMDRIPAHAAIGESVELVKFSGHPHAAGMVNAILRKVAATESAALKPKLFETVPAFAERLGHPAWLAERWAKQYGRAAALAICEYDQREPADADALNEAGGEDEKQIPFGNDNKNSKGENESVARADEPLHGALPMIDSGSRLVAELAAAVASDAKRVWDACAAPGGKTMVLATRLPDAEVLATDVSPRRLKSMAARIERAGLAQRVRTETSDATALPESEGAFDLVLCDVPCSGTGTLARNPEIRHRLEPVELSRQARRQREILRAALGRLAPGGKLVYSTCSLEPEENEAVVEEVLARTKGFRRVTLAPLAAQVTGAESEPLLRDGALRTLPGANFAGDGFFAVAIERVK